MSTASWSPAVSATAAPKGKILAAQYARENKIPYFGICLGMQIATIEFARNVCGLKGANSTEFDKTTKHPVICLQEEQKGVEDMGATMRLGSCESILFAGTKAADFYGNRTASTNATATATSSTPTIRTACRKPGW